MFVYICARICTLYTQRVLSPDGECRVWKKQRAENLEEELSASVNWQQEHKFAVNSNCLACIGTGKML